MRTSICIVVTLFLAASPGADAKRIYQYRDDKGVLHFTDRKPADAIAEVKETIVKVERQPIVDLVTSDAGTLRKLSFRNRLGGPVELELAFGTLENMVSEPGSPVRVVLPAQQETTVASLRAEEPGKTARYSVGYKAVPGDPNAVPRLDYGYAVPLPLDSRFEIHQGFGGRFSHADAQSFHAVDLAVDEGTPVLAARTGTVMQIEEDFDGAGLDAERFAARANHVRIVHEDGTMAVYAHLKLESVVVGVGQFVREGQKIGLSGNTGFSSGPHLHFAIQVNGGLELKTVPFRFVDLDIPQP
ncbi:MAG TPA: peptidoglycan DD-metalloendopeptidase family protein [Candidatus Saccharimonadia bacterium]|nr:peptidoglycan DD-metalloendopeptidase family protein [Candidatus Saccharimonadia bacterium]